MNNTISHHFLDVGGMGGGQNSSGNTKPAEKPYFYCASQAEKAIKSI